MIVDDSSFMRKIIKKTLEQAEHTVIAETDNGNDALEIYNKYKPDIVTMDITILGKDGLKVIKEITQKYPDAKIIVISALNERTLRLSDKQINAKAFLKKPFTSEELLQTIKNIEE